MSVSQLLAIDVVHDGLVSAEPIVRYRQLLCSQPGQMQSRGASLGLPVSEDLIVEDATDIAMVAAAFALGERGFVDPMVVSALARAECLGLGRVVFLRRSATPLKPFSVSRQSSGYTGGPAEPAMGCRGV